MGQPTQEREQKEVKDLRHLESFPEVSISIA